MIDQRESYLIEHIKGKKVLDLGVGDTSDRFLHKFLSEYAHSCVGVELDVDRAKRLKEKGYDIRTGNAETIDIKETFDVVVAGDLIEHLDNPGLFLDNVKKHLSDGGVFVFNTPNIYSINFLLRAIVSRGKVKQFEEHSLGFDQGLLRNLLDRYDFQIDSFSYYSHPVSGLKSLLIRFFGLFGSSFLENMFLVCSVKKA